MKKRDLTPSFILLGILIVAIGSLFLFSKLTFTGYVTNVGTNGTFVSSDFSTGIFENTKINDDGYVALNNATIINGNYLSKVFGDGQEVTWDNLTYVIDLPTGSNIVFYIRGCNDNVCDGEIFNELVSQDLNLNASYFQYKINMTRTLGYNSPKLEEINITYFAIFVQNVTQNQTTCGDRIIQIPNSAGVNETCDNGANNTQVCTANYGSSCTYCSSNCQTLIVQGASCGDGTCNSGNEDCSTCSSDCACSSGYTCSSGTCVAEETTENTENTEDTSEENTQDETAESEIQIPVTGETVNICTPNWQCRDWSVCENSQRIRECIDSNSCGSEAGIPITTETCEAEIKETCDDGIKNQNEEGVDCSGVCEKKCKKSFFNLVGNVINGPIEAGKTFFQKEIIGNKTRTFIILGVIMLIIAGFIVFKKFTIKIDLKERIQKQ